MRFRMRLPAAGEYERLCGLTDSDDTLIHWSGLATWVMDPQYAADDMKAVRGFTGPLDTAMLHKSNYIGVGFRPAFHCLTPEELPEDLQTGDVIEIGSLYMNDKPVLILQDFNDRRISRYWEGARLELRDAVDCPNFAIWGVYIGYNTFVADRPILRDISFEEASKI